MTACLANGIIKGATVAGLPEREVLPWKMEQLSTLIMNSTTMKQVTSSRPPVKQSQKSTMPIKRTAPTNQWCASLVAVNLFQASKKHSAKQRKARKPKLSSHLQTPTAKKMPHKSKPSALTNSSVLFKTQTPSTSVHQSPSVTAKATSPTSQQGELESTTTTQWLASRSSIRSTLSMSSKERKTKWSLFSKQTRVTVASKSASMAMI